MLCSWARHFTLTVPLSTQVYKWVPANLMLGVTWHPIQVGEEILLVASCYRNQDKLWPGGPHLARMLTLPMMLIVIFIEFATAGKVFCFSIA